VGANVGGQVGDVMIKPTVGKVVSDDHSVVVTGGSVGDGVYGESGWATGCGVNNSGTGMGAAVGLGVGGMEKMGVGGSDVGDGVNNNTERTVGGDVGMGVDGGTLVGHSVVKYSIESGCGGAAGDTIGACSCTTITTPASGDTGAVSTGGSVIVGCSTTIACGVAVVGVVVINPDSRSVVQSTVQTSIAVSPPPPVTA